MPDPGSHTILEDRGRQPPFCSDQIAWISVPGTGVSRRFITTDLVDEVEAAILAGTSIRSMSSRYSVSSYVVNIIYERMLESAIRDECSACEFYDPKRLSEKLTKVTMCMHRVAYKFRKARRNFHDDKCCNKLHIGLFISTIRKVNDNIHSNPLGIRVLKYCEILLSGIKISDICNLEDQYKKGAISAAEVIEHFMALLKGKQLKPSLKRFAAKEFCLGLGINLADNKLKLT